MRVGNSKVRSLVFDMVFQQFSAVVTGDDSDEDEYRFLRERIITKLY